MARKDYTPEQAIGMLREAKVRLSQGEKIGKICRGLGISEQSYYRAAPPSRADVLCPPR
jgi:putative transposase